MSNKPINTTYGIGSIAHLAPTFLEQIPAEMKCYKTLKLFKKIIKTWIPNKCPCRICKVYLQHVRFINYINIYLKGEKFRGKNFHGRKISRISRLLREKNLNFGDVIFAGLKNFRETFRGFSKKTRKPRNFMPRNFCL